MLPLFLVPRTHLRSREKKNWQRSVRIIARLGPTSVNSRTRTPPPACPFPTELVPEVCQSVLSGTSLYEPSRSETVDSCSSYSPSTARPQTPPQAPQTPPRTSQTPTPTCPTSTSSSWFSGQRRPPTRGGKVPSKKVVEVTPVSGTQVEERPFLVGTRNLLSGVPRTSEDEDSLRRTG